MSHTAHVQDTPQATPSRQRPSRIRYVPIAGEWARGLHPGWPESTFTIPQHIPEGHVYYVTKGDFIRYGATALVERLPSGNIAKSPMPNPYNPEEERRVRQSMEHEYDVYCFIGQRSLFIPRLIDWDRKSNTLVLEGFVNGDLETYLRNHNETDAHTRRRWALEAAQAINSLHAIGVIHQDISPRNFILNENLDLRICDFAGSSFPEHATSTGAPGLRYQSRTWDRGYVPTQADDIFSLGSLLFFIMSGEEPYCNIDEEEAGRRFQNSDFPATDGLWCSAIIQDCWGGHFVTAGEAVQALIRLDEIYRS